MIRVAVTGAAGQVAYAMLGRLASGEVFGPDTKVILQLLEIPKIRPAGLQPGRLEGVAMELDDCSFPTLQDIVVTDDPEPGLQGLQLGPAGRLLSAQAGHGTQGPARHQRQDLRRPGQGAGRERGHGRAHPGRRQSVQHQLPGRLQQRPGHSRRPLDGHDPARPQPGPHGPGQEGRRRQRGDVTCVTIWGNHSNTQYPDFTNAKIKGKPATEVITDRAWLENTFVPQCQNRGAAVIKARGSSSAMSAANGALDHVKSLLTPTPGQRLGQRRRGLARASTACRPGLVFGYPCRSDGKGNFTRRRRREARRFRPGEVPDHAQGTAGRTRRGQGADRLKACSNSRLWLGNFAEAALFLLPSPLSGGEGSGVRGLRLDPWHMLWLQPGSPLTPNPSPPSTGERGEEPCLISESCFCVGP